MCDWGESVLCAAASGVFASFVHSDRRRQSQRPATPDMEAAHPKKRRRSVAPSPQAPAGPVLKRAASDGALASSSSKSEVRGLKRN